MSSYEQEIYNMKKVGNNWFETIPDVKNIYAPIAW